MDEVIRAFAEECRGILQSDAGPSGLDKVRLLLEQRLLGNEQVINGAPGMARGA
jgi:hypothetical protein